MKNRNLADRTPRDIPIDAHLCSGTCTPSTPNIRMVAPELESIMRASEFLLSTLKETPADAEVVSRS